MSLLTAIILAAGKGTRMRSQLPKVLHKTNGKAMAAYAIEAALGSGAEEIVLVVGHEADEVKAALGDEVEYAIQSPQLGTGHALQVAIPSLKKDCKDIMVLCGDTPLLRGETLQKLYDYFCESKASCTVLSAFLPNPTGYGRLIRSANGNLKAIVEQKDASPKELEIKEINTGTYCFCLADILPLVNNLENRNAQGEYYITDLISALVAKGKVVNALPMEDITQVLGVNDRIQLAEASAILRQRKNTQLMKEGVTIIDPQTTYIESDCKVGVDSIIEPNSYLRGQTIIGENCLIGPNSDLKDCIIGDNSKVVNSILVNCNAGNNCDIGPFAYIRPGTILGDCVKVGGFVEMKKAHVDSGSKVPHLSYIGDALIGKKVNIGCGTITCNYDGYNKHQTIIEDGAFIGSNTNFIAPVRVGKNAHVAAGSTITQNVPENALGVARGKQRNIEGWVEGWHKRNSCKE